ncbi:hypothetical protein ACSQ67_017121 [Phaseolus vulgaris]
MVVLDLSNNKIRGSIPQGFREQLLHWKDIETIDLSYNRLQGDLPIPPSVEPVGPPPVIVLISPQPMLTPDLSSVL